MILGASILQLPAIQKAKQMGLYTIAVDMDKKAVGFEYADICLEISTIDVERVVEAAILYDVDGVMTLASDMPMIPVAAVVKELDLIGINEDTALKATNKAIMRQCLEDSGVPVPRFYRVDNHSEYIDAVKRFTGKFMVKPADNSGSRGVFLVDEESNIEIAYEYSRKHSRNGTVVVEEYMEGPEVSVETISISGATHVIAITDKITTGAPNFVEMGHSQPTRHPCEITKQIEQVARAAVKAVGIENGPSHTEIIITKEGPKIVELGARLGGDNITTSLVPLSTGIDIVECSINIALGVKPDIEQKIKKGSAIRYFETSSGRLESISNVNKAQEIPGVKQITFVKQIGDIIPPINSSNDRIGYVITQGDTAAEAIEICDKVKALIDIKVTAE